MIIRYLKSGEYLGLDPFKPVKCLIEKLGRTDSLGIISESDYPTKHTWLFCYYLHLPSNEITKGDVASLLHIYEISPPNSIIRAVDYLLKYEAISKGFVANLVRKVFEKSKNDSEYTFKFEMLLNSHMEVNKQLLELFSNDMPLLEKYYLDITNSRDTSDFNGETLSRLLDANPSFIDVYIEAKIGDKDYVSKHEDHTNYSFIWQREDYLKLMERVSELVFKYEKNAYWYNYLEKFFSKDVHPQTDLEIIQKQDVFLENEISRMENNIDYIEFLFGLISNFKKERVLKFFTLFLANNQNYSEFKRLPLFPAIGGWSGSAVAMYQKKLEYVEKLAVLCNTTDLLQHRQLLEKEMLDIRSSIKQHRKRDFTEDLG